MLGVLYQRFISYIIFRIKKSYKNQSPIKKGIARKKIKLSYNKI